MNATSVLSIILFLATMTSCSSTKKIKQSAQTATLVVDTRAQLGEGSFWDDRNNELYYIDIEGKKLFIYNPSVNKQMSYDMGQRIGTVVPTEKQNEAIVALQNGIYLFNTITQKQTLLCSPEHGLNNMRFNDGKCDPAGRFWVGSMHLDQTEGAASLYRIESTGAFEKMIPNVTISNGIVWSSDQTKMYYIDTPTGQVMAYDYDLETGNITNGQVAVKISEDLGYPDGMTIDSKGRLWIALWNGNGVGCWNPDNGKLIDFIQVPAHNVSSCTFGGDNLEKLYITTAKVDMTSAEKATFPHAGSLFVATPGVKGVKGNYFKGRK